jgi:hypothetical protein
MMFAALTALETDVPSVVSTASVFMQHPRRQPECLAPRDARAEPVAGGLIWSENIEAMPLTISAAATPLSSPRP